MSWHTLIHSKGSYGFGLGSAIESILKMEREKKVINDSEEHNEMKWFTILQLFLWHTSLNKRDGRIFIRCFHFCLFFFCRKGASPFPCKERFPILSFPIVILFRLVTYWGEVVPLIRQSPESLMWPIAVVVHRPLTSRIIG